MDNGGVTFLMDSGDFFKDAFNVDGSLEGVFFFDFMYFVSEHQDPLV